MSGTMDPPEAGPSYTVLRIKRKATDSPLSSLIIQDKLEPRRGIKKRLVSSRHRGVFRLAETVPGTWEGKGTEGEVLKASTQLEERLPRVMPYPCAPADVRAHLRDD
ncbi:hypothetical protein JCM24511_08361 [Saitozyma sp. JCM 24511]|nr:hypothetical protein JCM24511_08361 [Saitozyma sp. JCM 24511]